MVIRRGTAGPRSPGGGTDGTTPHRYVSRPWMCGCSPAGPGLSGKDLVVMMFWHGGGWAWWQAGLMWVGMIAFWGLLAGAIYALVTGATRRTGTGGHGGGFRGGGGPGHPGQGPAPGGDGNRGGPRGGRWGGVERAPL